MATESELRDLLKGPEPEGRTAIDLDAVLTRARRRRRPKLLAVQALGSVAVVGGLFAAVVATLPPQQQAASILAEDTAGGSGFSMPESADENARTRDACGNDYVSIPLLGWELDVAGTGPQPVDEPVVSVTLVNDTVLTAVGSAEIMSLTFFQDGVVVGHGAPLGVTTIDATLQPDEALTWDLPVVTTSCATGGVLEPGAYDVRASVLFTHHEDGTGQKIDPSPEPVYSTPGFVEIR